MCNVMATSFTLMTGAGLLITGFALAVVLLNIILNK